MNKEFLNILLNQLLSAGGIIALIMLALQFGFFLKENKKAIKWPLKAKAFKLKNERKTALLRWAFGVLVILLSFALSSVVLQVMIGMGSETATINSYLLSLEESNISFLESFISAKSFSYTGTFGVIGFFLTGLFLMLSSQWKKLRVLSDVMLWLTLSYLIFRPLQAAFASGVNAFAFISDASYYWLEFFGVAFFVLVLVFSVKGLLAFDHKHPRLVRQKLEQLLQLSIALIMLLSAQGIMNTLAVSYAVPESFRSFMLDTDFAMFRYAGILYLFGGGIFLRQIFPYFRWKLMALLSLTGAYFVFDIVNFLI